MRQLINMSKISSGLMDVEIVNYNELELRTRGALRQSLIISLKLDSGINFQRGTYHFLFGTGTFYRSSEESNRVRFGN